MLAYMACRLKTELHFCKYTNDVFMKINYITLEHFIKLVNKMGYC